MVPLALAVLLAGPVPAEAALDQVLRLVGRYNIGHACPIAPRLALTGAHVLDPHPEIPSPLSFSWSNKDHEASGFVVPHRTERIRDVGALEPRDEGDRFPYVFPIAAAPPKPGDRVWILGYDWRNRKSALGDEPIDVKVTRLLANHVVYERGGRGGSSGSCVLNDRGEVVAIHVMSFPTDDRNQVGVGVGLWGELRRSQE